ncbi:hypothetical protein PM082_018587 [Marasmius tenuissimus]|nr:hypothetical protein PM082_018587 [Marasmius tenuissimus]
MVDGSATTTVRDAWVAHDARRQRIKDLCGPTLDAFTTFEEEHYLILERGPSRSFDASEPSYNCWAALHTAHVLNGIWNKPEIVTLSRTLFLSIV